MNLEVTCAIIVDGGKVLCAQRGPTMNLPWEWEFPGGKIEPGETAKSCIVREIKEELNLDIRIVAEGPTALHPHRPEQLLALIAFVCVSEGGQLHLKEHAQVRWCETSKLHSLHWAKADLPIVDWWIANATDFQEQIRTV